MVQKRRSIPNFFTIGNLIGGILAILFSLTGQLDWAPYCIFGAIIFDFLDGFMAGLLKAKSDKGKQMDSLADIITFGVAPGFIVFVLLNISLPDGDLFSFLSNIDLPGVSRLFYISDVHIGGEIMEQGISSNFNMTIDFTGGKNIKPQSYLAFLIPIFALFRLAKFNVDTEQSDSFLGVPTATMAIFFAAFPLLIQDAIGSPTPFKSVMVENVVLNSISLVLLTIVLSILMVTRIPLIALKFKNFKWPGNEIRYIFLVLCLIAVIAFKFWAVPIVVILYILLSVINNIINRLKVKK